MEFEQYVNNLNIYEVDKRDYEAYKFKFKDREKVEHLIPEKKLLIVTDEVSGFAVYGVRYEIVDEKIKSSVPHYYIFEFLEEGLPDENLHFQEIKITADEWIELLRRIGEMNKQNDK